MTKFLQTSFLLLFIFSACFISNAMETTVQHLKQDTHDAYACYNMTMHTAYNAFIHNKSLKVDGNYISQYPELLDRLATQYHVTRLHIAATYNPKLLIQLLLHNVIDLEAQDVCGRTPLHYAAANSSACARILIKSGANVNATSNTGLTPLHYATRDISENIALLLAHGAQINAQCSNGATPLHYAAKYNTKSTEILLDNGANIDAQDINGAMAIHYAALENLESLKILLKEQALNAQDNTGLSPLHYAVPSNPPAVQLLLNHNANSEIEDENNATPLHHAAKHNHRSTLLLLKNNASQLARTLSGATPMHFAARFNNNSLRLLLADDNSNTEITDATHRTPLHYAMRYNLDAVTILIEHQADLDARDHRGITPLLLMLKKLCKTENYQKIAPIFKRIVQHINFNVHNSTQLCHYIKTVPINQKSIAITNILVQAGLLLDDLRESNIYTVLCNSLTAFSLIKLLKAVTQEGIAEVFQHKLAFIDSSKSVITPFHTLYLTHSSMIPFKQALFQLQQEITPSIRQHIIQLLKQGIPINLEDLQHKRLIDYAALAGNNHLFDLLLLCGAHVDDQTIKCMLLAEQWSLLSKIITSFCNR